MDLCPVSGALPVAAPLSSLADVKALDLNSLYSVTQRGEATILILIRFIR